LPLPPLDEQRRIVARIEALAAKIKEACGLRQHSLESCNAFLLSTREAAFRTRSGWTIARVGDFCDQPQYGFTASATTEPVGPRLLRITDIQNGQVDWETVPYCVCPNPEQYLLHDNDLVFARTGATTGKSFVIRDCPKAVFASYLIRLRVQRLATVQYVYQYFQTPSYWSQITDEKKGTGQPNVNGKKLADVRVPIAPVEEQHRIVTYLDNIQSKLDALKRLQSETAAELDALLPSILDKAFKGEL
jgi:type I restriction enzyme S subunit